ncbi:MAG: hypothetical protein WBB31_07755 [Saprospiraceae bacterium]
MKSTVLNLLSAKLAFVSLLLVGLFLLAPSHVQAQSTNDLFSAPNVSYVSSATAIARVEAKCLELKDNYVSLNAQSQAYNDNVVKYSFYTAILDKLNEGKTTKESLEAGLKVFGTDAASSLSKSNMQAYRLEAINLLRQ